MREVDPKTVCKDCKWKANAGSRNCPFASKWMCPGYSAHVAVNALEDKETALEVPVESLIAALRFHGYSGDLRKSSTVII